MVLCLLSSESFGAAANVANAKQTAEAAKATAKDAAAAAKPAAAAVPKTPEQLAQEAKAAKAAAEKKAAEELAKKQKAEEDARKKKIADRKKKIRTHTVDMQVISWDSKPSLSERNAHGLARKVVGKNGEYLVKDCIITADSGSKYICTMRIHLKDKIPDTWYLETEVAAGFGSTRQRAYAAAMAAASSKVDTIDDSAAWVGIDSCLRNSAENGVIPYNITFESIGGELYCKMFFRYFKKR